MFPRTCVQTLASRTDDQNPQSFLTTTTTTCTSRRHARRKKRRLAAGFLCGSLDDLQRKEKTTAASSACFCLTSHILCVLDTVFSLAVAAFSSFSFVAFYLHTAYTAYYYYSYSYTRSLVGEFLLATGADAAGCSQISSTLMYRCSVSTATTWENMLSTDACGTLGGFTFSPPMSAAEFNAVVNAGAAVGGAAYPLKRVAGTNFMAIPNNSDQFASRIVLQYNTTTGTTENIDLPFYTNYTDPSKFDIGSMVNYCARIGGASIPRYIENTPCTSGTSIAAICRAMECRSDLHCSGIGTPGGTYPSCTCTCPGGGIYYGPKCQYFDIEDDVFTRYGIRLSGSSVPFSGGKNYADAKTFCESQANTALLTIKSAAQWAAVIGASPNLYWLGATKNSNGHYAWNSGWMQGRVFAQGSTFTSPYNSFMAWQTGQPAASNLSNVAFTADAASEIRTEGATTERLVICVKHRCRAVDDCSGNGVLTNVGIAYYPDCVCKCHKPYRGPQCSKLITESPTQTFTVTASSSVSHSLSAWSATGSLSSTLTSTPSPTPATASISATQTLPSISAASGSSYSEAKTTSTMSFFSETITSTATGGTETSSRKRTGSAVVPTTSLTLNGSKTHNSLPSLTLSPRQRHFLNKTVSRNPVTQSQSQFTVMTKVADALTLPPPPTTLFAPLNATLPAPTKTPDPNTPLLPVTGTILVAGPIVGITDTAQTLQLSAIFAIMSCKVPSTGNDRLRVLMSPLNLGGRIGYLLGGVALTLQAMMMYCAVYGVAATKKGLEWASGKLAFPSPLTVILGFFYTGVCYEACVLLYGNGDPNTTELALGALFLALCVLVVVWYHYVIFAFRNDVQVAAYTAEEVATLPRLVAMLLLPRTYYARERLQSAFCVASALRPGFLQVTVSHQLLRSLVIAAVGAIAPGDDAACRIVRIVIACVCFVHAVFVLAMRAYRVPVVSGLQALQSLLLGLIALTEFTTIDPQIISLVLSIVSFLTIAAVVAVIVIEFRLRQARQQREQPTDIANADADVPTEVEQTTLKSAVMTDGSLLLQGVAQGEKTEEVEKERVGDLIFSRSLSVHNPSHTRHRRGHGSMRRTVFTPHDGLQSGFVSRTSSGLRDDGNPLLQIGGPLHQRSASSGTTTASATESSSSLAGVPFTTCVDRKEKRTTVIFSIDSDDSTSSVGVLRVVGNEAITQSKAPTRKKRQQQQQHQRHRHRRYRHRRLGDSNEINPRDNGTDLQRLTCISPLPLPASPRGQLSISGPFISDGTWGQERDKGPFSSPSSSSLPLAVKHSVFDAVTTCSSAEATFSGTGAATAMDLARHTCIVRSHSSLGFEGGAEATPSPCHDQHHPLQPDERDSDPWPVPAHHACEEDTGGGAVGTSTPPVIGTRIDRQSPIVKAGGILILGRIPL